MAGTAAARSCLPEEAAMGVRMECQTKERSWLSQFLLFLVMVGPWVILLWLLWPGE
jgi:hypothetical protein